MSFSFSFEILFVLLLIIRCFTVASLFLAVSVTAGARESGGGKTQGGGAEEEV